MEQIQNEGLDIRQMKQIAFEIFDEEKKKNNLDINVFPVTFIEFYKDYIFKGSFTLAKFGDAFEPLLCDGFYNKVEKKVVLFLNRINKIISPSRKTFRLAEICYHELRHSMQKKFDDYSYEGFLSDADDFVRDIGYDYSLKHDSYSFEIGANLYGIRRAKEFLMEHYPSLYEKEKEDIEFYEEAYYCDYMLYDASDTFDLALKGIRNYKNGKKFSKKYKKDNYPLFDMFLNGDGSFKKISEMLNDEKFSTLDERIVAAVLSSRTFLKETNMDELTQEELNVLNDALNYTNQVYQNQKKFVESHSITRITDSYDDLLEKLNLEDELVELIRENNKTLREINKLLIESGMIRAEEADIKLREAEEYYIKRKRDVLFMKIRYVSSYCFRVAACKLKLTRSEEARRRHAESIPGYIESANKVKKRVRNNGGFVSVIFLISCIILIMTIAYLLFVK